MRGSKRKITIKISLLRRGKICKRAVYTIS